MCMLLFVWDNHTNSLKFLVFFYVSCATMRTLFVPHQVFPNPPFFISSVPPSCAPSLHFCQNHRGSCLFALFFGNQSCRNHKLPTLRHPWTPPPHPSPLPPMVCVFLSPDARDACSGEAGVGMECVCVCIWRCVWRSWWQRMSRGPGGVDLYCGRDPHT